jgi:hypothetical protein
MSMTLLQKIRNMAQTAKEIACFASILGNETLPKPIIPSINIGNYITATTGEPLDTGIHGEASRQVIDNGLFGTNKIISSNLDPAFYTSLVTETELANLALKSTKVRLITGSMYDSGVGSWNQNAWVQRTNRLNTQATDLVDYWSNYNNQQASSNLFGNNLAPVQYMGYTDFPTEIGKKYRIRTFIKTQSLYQTNNPITILTETLLKRFNTISISQFVSHAWSLQCKFGAIGSTSTVAFQGQRDDKFQEVEASSSGFPSGFKFYNGEGLGYWEFWTTPATSTTSRIEFTAQLTSGWDAGNPSRGVISQTSGVSLTLEPNATNSNGLIIEGWESKGF